VENVHGKVAVITGGASGIGLALARRFGADGMRLVLADVEVDALAAAAADLRGDGIEVFTQVTDVSDGDQVDALGEAALEAFGAVHLVCNNAGVGGGGQTDQLTAADWEWVLGVNLWGVIHGMRVFLPMLLAQNEGHIVNTASMAGLIAGPFMGPYNASKFAVVAISETLFKDLQSVGAPIGVSVLCPGFVQTQIGNSARNAPPSLHEWRESDTAAATQQMANALADAGIEPALVAQHVLDAVRESRFYVIPHEQAAIDATESRVEWMRDGRPGKTDMSRALRP